MSDKQINKEYIDTLNKKWRSKTFRQGELKEELVYGASRKSAIKQGQILFYFSQKTEVKKVKPFLDYISGKTDLKEKIIIASDNIGIKNAFSDFCSVDSYAESFGSSETIVAYNGLPEYFTKRSGQKVYYLFPASGRTLNRIILANGMLSGLLNTACILFEDKSVMEKLRDEADFGNLYQGQQYVMKADRFYPEDSLAFIFGKTDSFEEIPQSLNNKKRILIYGDWNSEKAYEQELFKLLKIADKDAYDFTLVYKSKIKATLAEKRLMVFPKNVRVIYRAGGFACTPEEYVEFHSHIDKIQFLTDFRKYVTEINKEIYNAEIIRMTGINSFDIFLYFGPAYNLWYSIAECVNAKKKFKLEVEDYEAIYKMNEVNEDKTKELNNNLLLGKQIFDTIFFTQSANFTKKMLADSGLQPEKCTIPLDCSAISMNESEIKTTSIEQKNYGVLDVVYGSEAVKLCQLVSLPDKQKNAYITYGKSQRIGDVIKYYTENRKASDVLYIYSGDETGLKNSIDFYGIAENAVLAEELDINCIEYLKKYLEEFTGYIAADNAYNEIFWLMQDLGKPIQYIDQSAQGYPAEDVKELKETALKQFFPEI